MKDKDGIDRVLFISDAYKKANKKDIPQDVLQKAMKTFEEHDDETVIKDTYSHLKLEDDPIQAFETYSLKKKVNTQLQSQSTSDGSGDSITPSKPSQEPTESTDKDYSIKGQMQPIDPKSMAETDIEVIGEKPKVQEENKEKLGFVDSIKIGSEVGDLYDNITKANLHRMNGVVPEENLVDLLDQTRAKNQEESEGILNNLARGLGEGKKQLIASLGAGGLTSLALGPVGGAIAGGVVNVALGVQQGYGREVAKQYNILVSEKEKEWKALSEDEIRAEKEKIAEEASTRGLLSIPFDAATETILSLDPTKATKFLPKAVRPVLEILKKAKALQGSGTGTKVAKQAVKAVAGDVVLGTAGAGAVLAGEATKAVVNDQELPSVGEVVTTIAALTAPPLAFKATGKLAQKVGGTVVDALKKNVNVSGITDLASNSLKNGENMDVTMKNFTPEEEAHLSSVFAEKLNDKNATWTPQEVADLLVLERKGLVEPKLKKLKAEIDAKKRAQYEVLKEEISDLTEEEKIQRLQDKVKQEEPDMTETIEDGVEEVSTVERAIAEAEPNEATAEAISKGKFKNAPNTGKVIDSPEYNVKADEVVMNIKSKDTQLVLNDNFMKLTKDALENGVVTKDDFVDWMHKKFVKQGVDMPKTQIEDAYSMSLFQQMAEEVDVTPTIHLGEERSGSATVTWMARKFANEQAGVDALSNWIQSALVKNKGRLNDVIKDLNIFDTIKRGKILAKQKTSKFEEEAEQLYAKWNKEGVDKDKLYQYMIAKRILKERELREAKNAAKAVAQTDELIQKAEAKEDEGVNGYWKKEYEKKAVGIDEEGIQLPENFGGMTPEEAAQKIADMEGDPEFAKYVGAESEFKKNFIDPYLALLVQNKMINPELQKYLEITQDFYVPFLKKEYIFKEDDGLGVSVVNMLTKNVESVSKEQKQRTVFGGTFKLKKLTGSDKENVDLMVAAITKMRQLYGAIAVNDSKRHIADVVSSANFTVTNKAGEVVHVGKVMDIPYGTTASSFDPSSHIPFIDANGNQKMIKLGTETMSNVANMGSSRSWWSNARNSLGGKVILAPVEFAGKAQKAAMTTYNLAFSLVTQPFRDLQMGALMIKTNNPELSADYAKLIGKSQSWTFKQMLNKNIDFDKVYGADSKYAREYFDGGASLSGMSKKPVDLKTFQDNKGAITSPIKYFSAIDDHYKHVLGVLSEKERLPAYIAARKNGYSASTASSVAANITQDFFRKGETAKALDAAYYFYSASIGGTKTLIKALSENKKAQQGLGYLVALGYTNALYQDLSGNSEFFDKTETEHQRAIYIGRRGYTEERDAMDYKIPLAPGLNLATSLGRLAYMSTTGKIGGGDFMSRMGYDLTTTFSPTSSFDASVLAPAFSASANKDYRGNPIYKEQGKLEDGTLLPKTLSMYSSTHPLYKRASRFMSQISKTGTDVNNYETVGGIDAQPELYKYYLKAYGGVIGGLIEKTDDVLYTHYRDAYNDLLGEHPDKEKQLARDSKDAQKALYSNMGVWGALVKPFVQEQSRVNLPFVIDRFKKDISKEEAPKELDIDRFVYYSGQAHNLGVIDNNEYAENLQFADKKRKSINLPIKVEEGALKENIFYQAESQKELDRELGGLERANQTEYINKQLKPK